MSKITHAEVRMYKMGTGDCFAIKFFAQGEDKAVFKMMIGAGTWSGSSERLEPYILDLKSYLEDYADVLIVTHEHKDHVHAFDACKPLFTDGNFEVDEIWFGWTEEDGLGEVEKWKEEYGEKKKLLGIAAKNLKEVTKSEEFKKQFLGNKNAGQALAARDIFSKVLSGFADLHLSVDGNKVYKGGQAGMEVVKKEIKNNDIKFYRPGDVISDFKNAEGIKIYVLGPPELYKDVKKEAGGEGESYKHNKELLGSSAFSAAILNMDNNGISNESLLPFEEHFVGKVTSYIDVIEDQKKDYNIETGYDREDWRKIDFDWLFSAGSFALRMNSLTNNLSLAIAIEFVESGRVMLFPGDAEFGSWASWHQIKWNAERKNKREPREAVEEKHLTEDLLNRTVFYKVAHHLSHNGTAQKLGLEMMNDKDLAAMVTLDYSNIPERWTGTMPNRAIIKELLSRTKGRLMVMNEDNLFFDSNKEISLQKKIAEARARMTSREKKEFEDNFKQDNLHNMYIQYTVKA